MKNLLFRKATAEDIDSIVNVRRSAFTDEEARGFTPPGRSIFYSSIELRKAWDKENRLKDGWEIFVAEDNGEVFGFIVFKVENGVGYVDNINVSKKQQRKGVGKTLVSQVEKIVKSRGTCLMLTDTTENAEGIPWRSYAFWTKMGYKDTVDRLPTSWDFKEIRFVKNL